MEPKWSQLERQKSQSAKYKIKSASGGSKFTEVGSRGGFPQCPPRGFSKKGVLFGLPKHGPEKFGGPQKTNFEKKTERAQRFFTSGVDAFILHRNWGDFETPGTLKSDDPPTRNPLFHLPGKSQKWVPNLLQN